MITKPRLGSEALKIQTGFTKAEDQYHIQQFIHINPLVLS